MSSIPNAVIGILHSFNYSGRTLALGSTRPLTEIIARLICRGKGGRCIRLTTLSYSYAEDLKILGASKVWNPNVLSGLFRDCVPFLNNEAPHNAIFSIPPFTSFPFGPNFSADCTQSACSLPIMWETSLTSSQKKRQKFSCVYFSL